MGRGHGAERGGEVDRPSPAEHADGEVAQAGHDLGAGPVRTWEAHDLNLPVEPGVRNGRNALVRWAVLLEEVLP
jgi:hypothetical protein